MNLARACVRVGQIEDEGKNSFIMRLPDIEGERGRGKERKNCYPSRLLLVKSMTAAAVGKWDSVPRILSNTILEAHFEGHVIRIHLAWQHVHTINIVSCLPRPVNLVC